TAAARPRSASWSHSATLPATATSAAVRSTPGKAEASLTCNTVSNSGVTNSGTMATRSVALAMTASAPVSADGVRGHRSRSATRETGVRCDGPPHLFRGPWSRHRRQQPFPAPLQVTSVPQQRDRPLGDAVGIDTAADLHHQVLSRHPVRQGDGYRQALHEQLDGLAFQVTPDHRN